MALQLIRNTDNAICETDQFLDSLISIEHPEEYPQYVIHSPTLSPIVNDSQSILRNLVYIPGTHSCEYYHYSQKTNFKKQNKHFRKMGRLKQPGGSSCDQRR